MTTAIFCLCLVFLSLNCLNAQDCLSLIITENSNTTTNWPICHSSSISLYYIKSAIKDNQVTNQIEKDLSSADWCLIIDSGNSMSLIKRKEFGKKYYITYHLSFGNLNNLTYDQWTTLARRMMCRFVKTNEIVNVSANNELLADLPNEDFKIFNQKKQK